MQISSLSLKNTINRFAEDREEYVKVFWLFGYLFCVVSASTMGRTAADTLFLSRFDASYLSTMYLPQAAAMILMGFIFQRYSSKFRLDRLILRLIPLISFLVLISRLGVGTEMRWVFPVIYVVYDVFNFLMIVCFWQFATSVLDQRKVKRMIGWVGSGGIMGGILSGFGLKALVPAVGTANLIYFYAGLQLLCLIAVVQILRMLSAPKELFSTDQSTKKRPPAARKKVEAKSSLFQNVPHLKYVAIMSAALVLSLTLIDYQFKVILKETLQNEALAGFMGSFYGYSGLLALFVQLFVSGRVLTRFGVMTALLVFPIALFMGSFGVLLMPVLAMAVTVKGSDKVIGDTIYSSVSQLIMFPISPEWRGKAKGFLDGIVRNGAKGLAALCLLVVSRLFAPEQLSYIILVLLAICIAAAIKVKGAYLKTLLSTLQTGNDDLEKAELNMMDPSSRLLLVNALSSPDKQQVLYALRLLNELDSFDMKPFLPALLQHPAAEVCSEALVYVERVTPDGLEPMLQQLLVEGDQQVRARALVALAAYAKDEYIDEITSYLEKPEVRMRAAAIAGLVKYYGVEGMFRAVGTLKQLLESIHEEERMAMAALFGQIGIASFYKPLLALLQDASPQVRIGALQSAAALQVLELVPYIVPLLDSSETRRYAVAALAAYEEKQILPLLEPFLVEHTAALYLPQVYERIGTQRSFDMLMSLYKSARFELRDKILEALQRMNKDHWRVDEKQVEELILGEIQLYWKFAVHGARISGAEDRSEMPLIIEQTRLSVCRRIFQLLSLIIDAKTVQAVLASWLSGDSRQQANSTEVMDQMLQGNLRTELARMMSTPRTLTGTASPESLNEDALIWLYEQGDTWLRHWIRYMTMQSHSSRALAFIEEHANAEEKQLSYESLADQIERVRLLHNVTLFHGLVARDLSAIAPRLQKLSRVQGMDIIREGDPGDSLFIIHSGQAGVYVNGQKVSSLKAGDCFGEMAVLTQGLRTATIRAETDIELWELDSTALYEMMFDRTSIAIEMMKLLSRRLRTKLERGGQEAIDQITVQEIAAVSTVSSPDTADQSKDAIILRRILVLQKINLFAHLSQDDFIRLAQIVEEVTYGPGEVICKTGEFGDTMYGIIEGNVRVHNGNETFAMLGQGDCFGEMAVIDSGPRSADCTSTDRTVLLELQQDQVFAFCFQNIEVLRSMMRVLAERIKGMV
ncbi:cyclic nucleotide-binding domain-containing protein [Paenibacillus sp. WQ 127069]|uniref:ADP,ATP carrier protein n=1 Tax=Paenibacillus baimaensis TaxID=2982185 RepID=A0ABT2UAG7_9BACL|nr:Npt1/Npt2 family nucleotide transporter [Paenibacillus sp. WQ 127069]MCU6791625.1 cyclic nucleotide-binding domain-containing protein [Paenibacillus sp. WQ 127069]